MQMFYFTGIELHHLWIIGILYTNLFLLSFIITITLHNYNKYKITFKFSSSS